MAIVNFSNLASIGTVTDIDSHLLPAGQDAFAWSNSQNMRFTNNVVQKIDGYSTMITPSVAPYYHVRISNGSSSFYVYCGLNKIYTQYSGSQYNITRQSAGVDVNYSTDADHQWSHCILNGLPVFNNGVDIPQSWVINQATRMTNMAGWPTSYKAAVIRSYKAYLVALDVTDAVPVRDRSKVKWSAAALPAQLPTSWDISDPTLDAGEQSLSDSDGYLVDCLQLGDVNIIYKNTSTYSMQYVGGKTIFAFRKIFPNLGMLSKNCACAFEGKHLVVTNNDIIVHDGSQYQSVADGKIRKYIFTNINSVAATRTFVTPNYRMNEIWVCFPTNGSTYPNLAAIYNYKTNTWTKRTLPQTSWISCGFIDITTPVTFDSMTSTTYNAYNTLYDASQYNQTEWSLSMSVPDDTKIYAIDIPSTTTDNGNSIYAYLERTRLFPNYQQIKLVKGVWPDIVKLAGVNTTIDIYIGTEMVNGQVTWNGPYPFNTATDTKIDCFLSGRNISIRFSSTTDITWQMSGFSIDVDQTAKW